MGAKKKTSNTGKNGAGGKGVKGPQEQEKKAPSKGGGQKARVRHILCTKFSKKEEVLALWNANPTTDNFKDLAKQYSEDKARSGGFLGEQPKGFWEPAFEQVVYSIEVSSDKPGSNGVKPKAYVGQATTKEGYHLILVEARG
ncbi:Uu.00g005490.m01.CDS01 [Anthostomella pinea]|uniref:Peptidyl-prolyl cis-trans isomerase n=1 Tax=Anthostomella pinea TaxID=933095 RepID=A0AAI8YGH7_9PEZI|nr:Uu.00g005490.m01.CDS01 [Anthostomella pinea]